MKTDPKHWRGRALSSPALSGHAAADAAAVLSILVGVVLLPHWQPHLLQHGRKAVGGRLGVQPPVVRSTKYRKLGTRLQNNIPYLHNLQKNKQKKPIMKYR